MRLRTFLLVSSINLLALLGVGRADVTLASGPQPAHLLELFSSEGCSSCPPAEEWFSALRENPRLWKDIVPVEFHVDYWDNLGWPDPLATPGFTARQRNYAATWGADSVYTPGFVLDGREWRGRNPASIPELSGDAGQLTAVIRESGRVEITYQPPPGASGRWQAHAALLGMNIVSDVKAGENSGRRLVHDFAALSLQDAAMSGDAPRATLVLPANRLHGRQTALAVWVTEDGAQAPCKRPAASCKSESARGGQIPLANRISTTSAFVPTRRGGPHVPAPLLV